MADHGGQGNTRPPQIWADQLTSYFNHAGHIMPIHYSLPPQIFKPSAIPLSYDAKAKKVHMYILVNDRNQYFGLGPIPKPKPILADTFG
jgi:hypothetical protein